MMDRQSFFFVIGTLHPQWDWAKLLAEFYIHRVFMKRVLGTPRA